MGYFTYQLLIVPREGRPILVTRAMERAVVRDQVADVEHVGYSDGAPPPPPPEEPSHDLLYARPSDRGELGDHVAGPEPWSMSFGVATRTPGEGPTQEARAAAPVRATVEALERAGLGGGRLGLEMAVSFLPFRVARGLMDGLPDATWEDASGLVDDLRIAQSPREIELTRQAAKISESMMLAAIAAAGPGVNKRDVMAAIYQTMFQRGGTYPGFIPLVRSTRTLEHEHGTWDDTRLAARDVLVLEMAGCVRRYHAPMGRLVFIGRAPKQACPVTPGTTAATRWESATRRAGLEAACRWACGKGRSWSSSRAWSST